MMVIGVLTLQIQLSGCKSLKEKRNHLKPLIARLHREFNLSVAEIAQQDVWDEATIGCVMISNEHQFAESSLQTVVHWLNKYWPDVLLVDDHIEIIN
jgi:uncharacterized protein YlxP (DUF503 family)